MKGTCIFRDNDGMLKVIDFEKVVALIEFELGDTLSINVKNTDVCTEFDKKSIEKLLKKTVGDIKHQ